MGIVQFGNYVKLVVSRALHGRNQLWIQDFPLEGRRPPTRVLFGENMCENERIGCQQHPHESTNGNGQICQDVGHPFQQM